MPWAVATAIGTGLASAASVAGPILAAAAPYAGAAASLYGAVSGSGASQTAAGQQVQAAQQAQNTQLGIYNQIRNDLLPYNRAGQGATNLLGSYFGIGSGGPGGGYGGVSQSGGPGGFNEFQGAAPGMGVPGSSGGRLTGQAAAAALGPTNNLFTGHGNSPLQDIQQALILGHPISDASWAQAGLPPGGGPALDIPAPVLGQPQSAFTPQEQSLPASPTMAGAAPTGQPMSPNANNAFAQLQNYPGYQFQFDQGLQALNRNLSAGGRYTSGAMLKDAQTFGQGQAQSSVTNYLDMLKYLGTLGANAGATTGQAGTTAGQGIASSQMAGGSAAASGTIGANNAWQSSLSQIPFQSLFSGLGGGSGGGYSNSGGGMFNGNYLAPFNSAAAAMGY